MKFLFWSSLTLVFYAYAGYPLLVAVVAKFFPRRVAKGPGETPAVSVLLSAFNEEKHLEAKLLNLLEVQYPEDRLEILVGSDGASDRTDAIVSKFPCARVRFFKFVKNQGKPGVLNALAEEAAGDVLVFTDARQRVDADAVIRLVENFKDPSVGCVSGELFFESAGASGVGRGMGVYWRYEKFLRRCESEFGSMLGATGALYAVRRRLYAPIPESVLADDLFLPLAVVRKRFRAVFEPAARVYDRPSEKGGQEFKRKVRTLAGNFQVFMRFPGLFVPFLSPVAWQLFSHKLLRLAVPYALAASLVSSASLAGEIFYRAAFFLQAVFYLAAAAEAIWESGLKRGRGVAYLPYLFCVLNAAAVGGLWHFLRRSGQRGGGAWEKAYA